jgi:hypothetical protein
MKRWVSWLALVVLVVHARPVAAQDAAVGELRIVDASGAEAGREQAAGEKVYRLPSGVHNFRIAFDFKGQAATDVQVRVMGPSGTVLLQHQESYAAPATYYVDYDGGDQALADQEYVVNVYLGADAYLADSLQLVVGEASISRSEMDATAAMSDTARTAAPLSSDISPVAPRQGVPGGPSWIVLAVAALGIVVLGAVVVWAAWSAMRR